MNLYVNYEWVRASRRKDELDQVFCLWKKGFLLYDKGIDTCSGLQLVG